MNPIPTRALAVLALAAALAGCAGKAPPPTLYDFGPLAPAPAAAAAPGGAPVVLVLADATGPAWLDSQRMYYRLLYDDARQTRPYAHNHWSATPLQLLSQRLKARIAQSGIKVLSSSDAAAGAALLRIEVDDFSHNFDSDAHSSGQLNLRASLLRGHRLLDQRSFSGQVAADGANAAAGAAALAGATDAVAAELIAWLARQPQPRQ